MRQFVIPWHRQIADTIHAAGKPAILHSCGNQDLLYGDIIAIGYDAKHSYEHLQGRIAVLGGIDLDFVCRSTPQQVYERSREMLVRADSRGGYALGTGNSVPEYTPDESYFAMIAAALEAR